MRRALGTCQLSEKQIIDEYFMEQRNKVLDLAAFLDRLDRTREHDAPGDFRLTTLRAALRELCSDQTGRLTRIQLTLSDPSTELLDQLDRKSAFGAYPGPAAEAR
jgi:hypothetical protein